ncbi:VOC family protein [Amycolatopsis albispora]|uniref:Glycosyltransferase n=1 Tax=Amycolatopsis albispora TaxID=1804986 RepID=A0A344L4F9_9PSEU|nr:VOC family protein [Amycolatopsis albispora]AXB42933.1 glycosyltransferase [Amycolatopsis albispora]
MSEYRSPVPLPGPGATDPGIYREIYPMPMFVIVPTADLEASKEFWMRGLGFADLFSAPGQVTHLRRWAFQDVLLVPGEPPAEPGPMSTSFSCVLDQINEIAARCEELRPGSVGEPVVKPWNSMELEVITPENARVVMTAARVFDPDGPEAEHVRRMGIEVPRG